MTRMGRFVTALAMGGLVVTVPSARAQTGAAPAAQQSQDHQQHHPDAAPPAPQAQAPGAQMMNRQRQMMADMKAADGKIDALVAKMNTVTGTDKVDAIAELLTALVQQDRAMRNGMMEMHGQMMQQMMNRTTSQTPGGTSPSPQK